MHNKYIKIVLNLTVVTKFRFSLRPIATPNEAPSLIWQQLESGSKILEKLFNRRLTEFLEKYKVISPTQYGFREIMSTCFALNELVDEITASLDTKVCTMGVFIYLKKPLTLWTINYCAKKLNFMASVVLH